MITINDLFLIGPAIRLVGPSAERNANPFLTEHVLQESQLLDFRFDVKTGVAAFIFELRSALQLDEGSTGVLIAYGVRSISWVGPARDTALTAWVVGSSVPHVTNELVELKLALWPAPGGQMLLIA